MPDFPAGLPLPNSPISLILPVRDEEATLETVLTAWIEQLDGLKRDYEIIVVDDGSTDRTKSLAEVLTGCCTRLSLVSHDSPRGFGACLRSGLKAARYPLLAYCLGNDQYRASDLPSLLAWIDKADLVAGYRTGFQPSLRRRWADRWFRWFVRILFGIPMRDLNCFYLLARRAVFSRIPIQSEGPFAHAEILAKANFLGSLIHEVPVKYRSRGEGSSSLEQTTRRTRWAEARQVLANPDFGPAILPEETNAAESQPLGPAIPQQSEPRPLGSDVDSAP